MTLLPGPTNIQISIDDLPLLGHIINELCERANAVIDAYYRDGIDDTTIDPLCELVGLIEGPLYCEYGSINDWRKRYGRYKLDTSEDT